MPWLPGDVLVRREVWHGRPWMPTTVIVVADDHDLLATYLPEGAGFSFFDIPELRSHPWAGRGAWTGPRGADVAAAGRAVRDLALLGGRRA